jgi:hypothetical protein
MAVQIHPLSGNEYRNMKTTFRAETFKMERGNISPIGKLIVR